MSILVSKVEYECDCGVSYGACGAKCAVIIVLNNVSDIYSIYFTDGHPSSMKTTSQKTTKGGLNSFTESYFEALKKAINFSDKNKIPLTLEEQNIIFPK